MTTILMKEIEKDWRNKQKAIMKITKKVCKNKPKINKLFYLMKKKNVKREYGGNWYRSVPKKHEQKLKKIKKAMVT